MDSVRPTVVYTKDSSNNFFRKRYTTTAAFAIGVLLFLMPFTQLQCGTVTIAQNSGIGLAAGREWKVTMLGGTDNLFNKMNEANPEKKKEHIKIPPDWFILIALAFGITGLIISFTSWKMKSIASMSLGILAAVMLVAAMVHLKMLIKSQIPKSNKNDSLNMNMEGLITMKFTIWYYFSLVAFIAAAFFGYKHHQNEMNDAIAGVADFDFQRQRE